MTALETSDRLRAALHLTVAPIAITFADAGAPPDVVLVRTNARGVMTIGDAVPDLVIERKPQCHIVAIAKEQHRPAASVGCALPGARAEEIVGAIETAALVDATVARYAAADAERFASVS